MSVFCTMEDPYPARTRLTPRMGRARMKIPMEDGRPVGAEEGASRFELAPPRRFILPAILLLLSEHSGYGYGLVPRLEGFHFGHVDRPAVYRALAQLENDGLVQAAEARNPGAGDAVLAEVEGGWSSALGAGWSPVSSTSGGWRRPLALESEADPEVH